MIFDLISEAVLNVAAKRYRFVRKATWMVLAVIFLLLIIYGGLSS